MIELVIHGWSTECGACGYGSGGWASSTNPALEGKPILAPGSTVCHGCGETFTHVRREYHGASNYGQAVPISEEDVAA